MEIKKKIKNAQNCLIRSEAYCRVIKELFIFLGCEPFSEDFLNYTLEEDIKKFISKQENKLSNLKLKDVL